MVARSEHFLSRRPAATSLPAPDLDRQLRLVVQRLEHHAIALRQLEELIDLLLGSVGVDLEGEADRTKSHRGGLVDSQRTAEIEVALGGHGAFAQVDLERR